MKKGALVAVLLVLLAAPLAYALSFDDFKSSFLKLGDLLTGSAVDSPNTIFGLGDSWNLVSVPFKDAKVSGCDKAYYYDSENKKYEKIVSADGKLPLEHGKGYWIRGPCTLKVEGSSPVGVDSLGLKKDAVLYSGYNLLGVTKNGFNLQQNKGSCEFEKVYYYDGTRYIPVDYTNQNLEEGKSYWVKAKSSCMLENSESFISYFYIQKSNVVLIVNNEDSLNNNENKWKKDLENSYSSIDTVEYKTASSEILAGYLDVFVTDYSDELNVNVLIQAYEQGSNLHLIGDATKYNEQANVQGSTVRVNQ